MSHRNRESKVEKQRRLDNESIIRDLKVQNRIDSSYQQSLKQMAQRTKEREEMTNVISIWRNK